MVEKDLLGPADRSHKEVEERNVRAVILSVCSCPKVKPSFLKKMYSYSSECNEAHQVYPNEKHNDNLTPSDYLPHLAKCSNTHKHATLVAPSS
jgi:hypothetical protein